jgi:hypothetical protein
VKDKQEKKIKIMVLNEEQLRGSHNPAGGTWLGACTTFCGKGSCKRSDPIIFASVNVLSLSKFIRLRDKSSQKDKLPQKETRA